MVYYGSITIYYVPITSYYIPITVYYCLLHSITLYPQHVIKNVFLFDTEIVRFRQIWAPGSSEFWDLHHFLRSSFWEGSWTLEGSSGPKN